jgi:hypothetical protein
VKCGEDLEPSSVLQHLNLSGDVMVIMFDVWVDETKH